MNEILEDIFNRLENKYGNITLDMLKKVLIPSYYEIIEINRDIIKKGSHFTVIIKLNVGDDGEAIILGQTGKILSKNFIKSTDNWRELGKARIHEYHDGIAIAELFSKTGKKDDLESALESINIGDFMEIDNYGLSASLTSALAELSFSELAKSKGFTVFRMPEDIAKHLMPEQKYYNFDFLISKDGYSRRVEVKSLWGTNTDYARLIHSKTKGYETSSCKFSTQDIFAVNLWLRTGNIGDFAFAISKYKGDHSNGLPCATGGKQELVEYVHQNPLLNIGDGIWFDNIDDLWAIVTK